jgi:hypothetical protein
MEWVESKATVDAYRRKVRKVEKGRYKSCEQTNVVASDGSWQVFDSNTEQRIGRKTRRRRALARLVLLYFVEEIRGWVGRIDSRLKFLNMATVKH